MNIYELYRHNRPWKFSDSKVVRKAELTKEGSSAKWIGGVV